MKSKVPTHSNTKSTEIPSNKFHAKCEDLHKEYYNSTEECNVKT